MALWSGLGQAATVAQLIGADAAGLVSAILQAVRTARRNRRECRLLARRVMMVSDLLQLLHLQGSETTRRPEVARALDGLGGALQQAYELVESCQEGSAVYGFIMSGRQAEQFRDVQDEIDSYLLVFPVVSHIDITRRLDAIYNILLPQQVSEDVPGSTTSHLEPDVSNQENAFDLIQLESNQATTEIFGVGQDQRTGHQEGLEELLSRDQRSKWLCWWPGVDTRGQQVFELLKAATNNFSLKNELGRGGSATIYKGQICNGLEIAVKRYHEDVHQIFNEHEIPITRYNEDVHGQHLDYDTECQVVAKLHHSNIVKLLGNSTHEGNRILVYEYMPNGSLDKCIFGKCTLMYSFTRKIYLMGAMVAYLGRGVSLDWLSRFRIIGGIVQGLIYLHTYTPHIVHRDVKPSNILLDTDMNAKISDFGIAIMLSAGQVDRATLAGTIGYLDPHYLRTGTLSTKVDVYSFGITLLEIIAARRCYDSRGDEWLLLHAWDLWTRGRAVELLDPPLPIEHQTAEVMVTRCVQIALLCVHSDPADRPTMSDVFAMLTSENISLPDPVQGARCGWPEHKSNEVMYESDATWSSADFTWPR